MMCTLDCLVSGASTIEEIRWAADDGHPNPGSRDHSVGYCGPAYCELMIQRIGFASFGPCQSELSGPEL